MRPNRGEERILFIRAEHTGFIRDDGGLIFTQISYAIFNVPVKFPVGISKSIPSEHNIFWEGNCVDYYEQYITGAKKLKMNPNECTLDSDGNPLTIDYLNKHGQSLKHFFKKFFSSLKEKLLPFSFKVYGFKVIEDLTALEYAYKIFLKNEIHPRYFQDLKQCCWKLNNKILEYYPNFKINPLKRHNSTYDIYLNILVYVKQVDYDEKKKNYSDYSDEWKEFENQFENENENENENINVPDKRSADFQNQHNNLQNFNLNENDNERNFLSKKRETNTLVFTRTRAEKSETKTKTKEISTIPPGLNSSFTTGSSNKNKDTNSNSDIHLYITMFQSIGSNSSRIEEFISYNPSIKLMLFEFMKLKL